MRDFIEYVAKGLVDEPAAVQVDEQRRRDRIDVRLMVAEHDMGKVIGKGGRIAHALRSMLNAAGAYEGVRVGLDIGEPGPRRPSRQPRRW